MTFHEENGVRFPESVKPLMVPLDDIKEHPRNANRGDVDAIVDSIKHNGFTTVVTVDARTRQIVAGNHRYKALRQMGATRVPAVFVEYNDENEARRILVADNQTGHLAEDDTNILMEHLQALKETDLGLAGTGVTEDKYEELLMMLNAEDAPDLEQGGGLALHNIFEVTVTFDNEDDRDTLESELLQKYKEDAVRTVNL